MTFRAATCCRCKLMLPFLLARDGRSPIQFSELERLVNRSMVFADRSRTVVNLNKAANPLIPTVLAESRSTSSQKSYPAVGVIGKTSVSGFHD